MWQYKTSILSFSLLDTDAFLVCSYNFLQIVLMLNASSVAHYSDVNCIVWYL